MCGTMKAVILNGIPRSHTDEVAALAVVPPLTLRETNLLTTMYNYDLTYFVPFSVACHF
jgi:hypothetical protein